MQFAELGMGTTALQDGSLPAPRAVLLVNTLVSPWMDSQKSLHVDREDRVSKGCKRII